MSCALILDFGGVISRTLFETHHRTEQCLGLPSGSLKWRGPFDPDNDALWRAMQAGHISERDYWLTRSKEVGLLLGEHWTSMKTLVRRARGADAAAVIRPEAVVVVRRARAAGYRLAILSNELDLFYGTDFRQRLPLLNQFEAIVDASHTGVLKPALQAYQLCEQAIGLTGESCVLVDDQLRNIAGAQAAGWQGVHFDVSDPAGSFERALGVCASMMGT